MQATKPIQNLFRIGFELVNRLSSSELAQNWSGTGEPVKNQLKNGELDLNRYELHEIKNQNWYLFLIQFETVPGSKSKKTSPCSGIQYNN